jgi:hypothetical protein
LVLFTSSVVIPSISGHRQVVHLRVKYLYNGQSISS